MKPSTQRFDRQVFRLWKHRGQDPKAISLATARPISAVRAALRRQRLRLAGHSPYQQGVSVRTTQEVAPQ